MKMRMTELIREEVEKKGLKKGLKEGRKKGREEGKEEGREAVALQMLEKGMDIATICECTDLTEKQVNALKSKKAA